MRLVVESRVVVESIPFPVPCLVPFEKVFVPFVELTHS